MKKKYICAIGLMGATIGLHAQQQFQGTNFGDMPKPVPSVSSLSTYTESPPSLATGIPNIAIPLLAIPASAGTNLNVTLNYNPINAAGEEAAGETGTGWSLFKAGVISRNIVGNVDEIFQSTANPNYQKNIFDDEYYYNIPGMSGKFKIERNTELNTFKIIDLTPLNHVKIEYTKQNNDATLIINSFTITDDSGTKYYFNDFSSSVVYDGYYDSMGVWGMEYKSAFFLTQIKNASETEIAHFIYKKEAKYEGTMLLYRTCKLEKILAPAGNIEFEYEYDQTLEKTMNDPYSIKSISLNNSYSKVAEYAFEYSYPQMTYSQGTEKRRQLERIKKISGQNILEQTSFIYNPEINNTPEFFACGLSGDFYPSNVLRKIVYPTKGTAEYVYERSDIFTDKNTPYILENMLTSYNPCMNYSQTYPEFGGHIDQQTSYTFTVSGDPTKKKAFWMNFSVLYDEILQGPIDPNTGLPTLPPPITENQKMNYTLKKGNEVIAASQKGEYTQFINYPGQYTLTVNVNGVGGEVNLRLTELIAKPGPYRNAQPAGEKYRIKSIKRYDNINSSVPEKSIQYNYDSFSISNSSSGYFSLGKDLLFKNVKVTEDAGNGYTQYVFKTPEDYPSYPYLKDGQSVAFWPYYNITETGLIEKKEVYNENNQLLAKESYEYTFDIADDNDYFIQANTYSKTARISYSKTSAEAYPSASLSDVLKTSNENTFRADNFKIGSSKSISQEGTTTETFYKYPQDKNLTSLLSAEMTGIPVETEIKINGKTIGKSETKFENSANKYPSSSIETNPNDNSTKTVIRYDAYDLKGNITQYTAIADEATAQGIPTAIIWGYNDTLPIAKVEGATLNDLTAIMADIVAKSNLDTDNASEKLLIQTLDAFRTNAALKNFRITTYTYDPLIGVTSLTPPNGIREMYQYDNNNRLITVVDVNGNILKDYRYNTKP